MLQFCITRKKSRYTIDYLIYLLTCIYRYLTIFICAFIQHLQIFIEDVPCVTGVTEACKARIEFWRTFSTRSSLSGVTLSDNHKISFQGKTNKRITLLEDLKVIAFVQLWKQKVWEFWSMKNTKNYDHIQCVWYSKYVLSNNLNT